MKTTIALLTCFAGTLAPVHAAVQTDAEKLYKTHCAACHGVEGNGGAGENFHGKLTYPTSKAMFGVIKKGIPGTAMPPSGLPDKDVQKLVSYVQALHRQHAKK